MNVSKYQERKSKTEELKKKEESKDKEQMKQNKIVPKEIKELRKMNR